ncbi:hypothetical protein WN943_000443 [Citrus x changshan-huyou]
MLRGQAFATSENILCLYSELITSFSRTQSVNVFTLFWFSMCRPLLGSIGTPCFTGKQSKFVGHLALDKLKFQMQREMREAVSTSHCSQPNSLEYDMAIEWSLLQERLDCAWKKLYEQQELELKKLKVKLKSK